jgi:DNA-3-methyladenine glycosylase I
LAAVNHGVGNRRKIMTIIRCGWCGDDPLYQDYHDTEWGVPLFDDRQLFTMLILEGAQAGLSWLTILKKRQNYFKAFDQFDMVKIANYTDRDRNRLLNDKGIVRNRLKIDAAIKNAQGALTILEEIGSLSEYFWRYVNHRPVQNSWKSLDELPSQTKESISMSKDLKKRGFNFVGPTICYAFMQSVGMVNDHTVNCFRYLQLRENA